MAITTREALHRIIDALPEHELDRAQGVVELLALIVTTPHDDLAVGHGTSRPPRVVLDEGVVNQIIELRNELLRGRGIDPVLRALDTAPIDDEPLTSEEIKILDERHRSIGLARTRSDDELDL